MTEYESKRKMLTDWLESKGVNPKHISRVRMTKDGQLAVLLRKEGDSLLFSVDDCLECEHGVGAERLDIFNV